MIKIKDFNYLILEVDNIECKDENKVTFGETNFEKQEIKLLKTLPPLRKRKVLIHEITHAFLDAYGFNERIFNEEELCIFNECFLEDILNIVNDYFNK